MFRKMRRIKQLLSEEETIEILESCTSGVLATKGDNEYPYAVPLSYAYKDRKLFFHFAKEGQKLDSITKNNKVSFCAIKTDNVSKENFTTHFSSVIVFGRVRILTNDTEKKQALEYLVEKYSPDYIEEAQSEIEREWKLVLTAELQVEYMTGKAAIEIMSK